MFGRKKPPKPKKVGGFAFFLSYGCLAFVCLANLSLLPTLMDYSSAPRWGIFVGGALVGSWIASICVRGRFSVFLHEIRHFVLSGLVGNRPKALKIKGRDEGEFQYEYTRETAPYNAFIALAPYYLPIFTFLGSLIGMAVGYYQPDLILLCVALGYGIDLTLNLRDVSHHQSDISLIVGGYRVGWSYILLMNTAIFSFLAGWVSAGNMGIKFLLYGLWRFMLQVVAYYRGG